MQKRSSSSVRIFYPKFDRERLIHIISERLADLKRELPLIKVILFCSYAKGKYTVGSDVDLLIVYKGEHRTDAYALVKKILDVPRLEPHIYTRMNTKRLVTC
jgi:hypothetical protein